MCQCALRTHLWPHAIDAQKVKASGASGDVRIIIKNDDVLTLAGYLARERIVCVNIWATGIADPEHARTP